MYGLTRQAYYRHFERGAERVIFEDWLVALVKRVRKRLPQSGGDNLWQLINRLLNLFDHRRVGRDWFANFLVKRGLKVRYPSRYQPRTTYSGHSYAVQKNLLRKLEITGPGQVLVADITYISLDKKHAYLFLVTDAYSRMIVGHYLSADLSNTGAVKALKRALRHIPEPKGVIHHSDRGVQYCCHSFLDEIGKWQLRSSMTDGDHCAQNALAECMNGILKREFLLGLRYPSFSSAAIAADEAVQAYNHFRLHGQLKGRTPVEVHYGSPELLELWTRELRSFQPIKPELVPNYVNSI